MIVRSGEVDLVFDEWGCGDPPLVLLHGFANSRADWADVAPALAADRRVIAYDQRGHGDSTKIGRRDSYSISHLVDDLAFFIAERRLAPIDLLGHSLGGIVAMRFAAAHCERLRSLILTNAAAAPVAPVAAPAIERLAAIGRERGMASLADFLGGIRDRGPQSVPVDAVQRERARRNIARADVEAFAALGVEIGSYDSVLAAMPALALPVTVIVGEHDTLIRAACQELAAAIAGARFEVIVNAAHEPHQENSAGWLAAVRAHLARLSPPDGAAAGPPDGAAASRPRAAAAGNGNGNG